MSSTSVCIEEQVGSRRHNLLPGVVALVENCESVRCVVLLRPFCIIIASRLVCVEKLLIVLCTLITYSLHLLNILLVVRAPP